MQIGSLSKIGSTFESTFEVLGAGYEVVYSGVTFNDPALPVCRFAGIRTQLHNPG